MPSDPKPQKYGFYTGVVELRLGDESKWLRLSPGAPGFLRLGRSWCRGGSRVGPFRCRGRGGGGAARRSVALPSALRRLYVIVLRLLGLVLLVLVLLDLWRRAVEEHGIVFQSGVRVSLQNAWKLLQIGGDVGGQVGADTASWNLLVESLYERALDVGFGHVGRLGERVSTPNHFVFVAVLRLVSSSSPNLLDVELVVGQIVIDVAVDGARECVASVGVMLSDGSDSKTSQ